MKYHAELREWLNETATRFRAKQRFVELARIEVARDILADAEKEHAAVVAELTKLREQSGKTTTAAAA